MRGSLRALLGRLAAGAPARVFPLPGRAEEVGEALDRVSLDPRLRLVPSPRSANVLLAVGRPASRLLRSALRIHDQASRPRATVWWLPGPAQEGERGDGGGADVPREVERLAGLLPPAELVRGGPEEAADAVTRLHRQLLAGSRETEPEVLPDEEPNPWRGVGPHGQGGEGMMGGTPYGRPMAMTGPDLRDGLQLDRLPVRLGPFFPPLPPGLMLDVELQGDLFQRVTVAPNPFDRPAFRQGAWRGDPFAAALSGAVPIAELEQARARHHLRWLARTLRLHDLPALAERALRIAFSNAPHRQRAEAVRRLETLLRRTRALRWATRGLGSLDGEDEVAGLGPVARAAGLEEDARTDEPAYRELGFEPVVTGGGDAWARLLQRMREAALSLELVARALERTERAGDAAIGPAERVEGPRGALAPGGPPPSAHLLERVPELLKGLEWGDAVTVLASLDLDPEEAGRGPVPDGAERGRRGRDRGERDRSEPEPEAGEEAA